MADKISLLMESQPLIVSFSFFFKSRENVWTVKQKKKKKTEILDESLESVPSSFLLF